MRGKPDEPDVLARRSSRVCSWSRASWPSASHGPGSSGATPRSPTTLLRRWNPPRPQLTPARTPSLWLVDGFNVLHAGVLHGRDRAQWWTEPRREQLVAIAARFDDAEAEIWIVFDGSGPEAPAEPPASRVRQVFAPSADDWLVAKVRASETPACLAVVTADRAVAGRARHRGAQVVSPRSFLARCQG